MSRGPGALQRAILDVVHESSDRRLVDSVLWTVAERRQAVRTDGQIEPALLSSFQRAFTRLVESDHVTFVKARFVSLNEVVAMYGDATRDARVRELRRLVLKEAPAFLRNHRRRRYNAREREDWSLAKRRTAAREQTMSALWKRCEEALRRDVSGTPHFSLVLGLLARGRSMFTNAPHAVSCEVAFSELVAEWLALPASDEHRAIAVLLEELRALAIPHAVLQHAELHVLLYELFSSGRDQHVRLTKEFALFLRMQKRPALRSAFPPVRGRDGMMSLEDWLEPDAGLHPLAHRIFSRHVFNEQSFVQSRATRKARRRSAGQDSGTTRGHS